MDSWGCEFLDLGEKKDYIKKDPKIHYLPMELVEKMVNPQVKHKILTKDIDYVHHLRYLINKDGLQYPGLVLLAPNGAILQDGNHRFFAMLETYSFFPVKIRISENSIKVQAGSYRDILPYILEKL